LRGTLPREQPGSLRPESWMELLSESLSGLLRASFVGLYPELRVRSSGLNDCGRGFGRRTLAADGCERWLPIGSRFRLAGLSPILGTTRGWRILTEVNAGQRVRRGRRFWPPPPPERFR
jgi:hypothetical protein